MMRLGDKVCVITGSCRGIGKAVAHGFAQEGGKVVITYLKEKEKALEVARETNAGLTLQLDVRDRMSIRQAFKKVADHYGYINILFANI